MFCVLVNNTNDILILLLSISVWVKLISQILKPNCREKEFLEFFRDSDIPVPPPDIPSQPQILAKSSSEVALTSIGKSARKFQGPGYSGSPTGYSEATSGKLAKSRFRSGTDFNRKISPEISRTRIFRFTNRIFRVNLRKIG